MKLKLLTLSELNLKMIKIWLFSKKLATIIRDVPIDFKFEDYKFEEPDEKS